MINLPKIFDSYIAALQKKAAAVIAIAVVLTSAATSYSFLNFSIDADLSGMISEELPFRQLENDLKKTFPQLSDTIVIVIEGDTAEGTATARSRLAEGLRSEQKVFKSVFEPGGGAFFDRNGLLYLDIGRLQDVSDNVAAAQPLLALLSEELSLRNMFSVLNTVVENIGEMEIPPESMNRLFDEVADSFESVLQGKKKKIAWQELMLGESGVSEERRQFIIVKPYLAKGALFDASRPLDAIRRVAGSLALDASHGITVRTTGDIPLAHENLVTIQGNIGFATAASVLLVAIILTLAVGGSARLVAINLFTLAIGFIWTLAFAIAATGTLNLISITFGVLYIGLGIDFSLLFCLRYRELIRTGMHNSEAITVTYRGVGKGLFLCAAAAAIGFYSFIPTAYAGASDLGLISGTGMFINLLANLILLPTLLTVFPLKKDTIRESRLSFLPLKKLASLPYRHCKAIACGAAFLAVGAAAFLPGLSFDYNPLNLYNPASEPVVTARELFRDPETSPWTISVVTETGEKARSTAASIAKLKEVKAAVTIFDFIPEDQPEKLAVISDMALFMPPVSSQMEITHASPVDNLKALSLFAEKLYQSDLLQSGPPNPHALRLYERVEQFRKFAEGARNGDVFMSLESALLSNLPILLNRLNDSLQAGPVGLHDLPRELHEQYVSAGGAYRVQIFPRENISDIDALARFVTAVQKAAPTAIDAPVSIYESGKAVVSSFRQAAVYAVVAITLFLILQLRSFMAPLLILAPFGLAFLLTAASSVLLGIPLNFANIIVLPLLLGLGIDNDIHLLHRYRTEPPENGNLLETSNSRAVIFSTITNVAGFGTLSWMPHRGLASMGILLTLCMGFLILSTIIVLPALVELVERRRRSRQEDS